MIQKNSLDRKINDRGVLFNKERVLREPLDVQDEIRRQSRYFESFHEVLFVGFIFFFTLAVKFGQQLIKIHLQLIFLRVKLHSLLCVVLSIDTTVGYLRNIIIGLARK